MGGGGPFVWKVGGDWEEGCHGREQAEYGTVCEERQYCVCRFEWDIEREATDNEGLVGDWFRLVAEGMLRVVTPIRDYGLGDGEGAFRSLQKGYEGGKVVIRMDGEEMVKMVIPREMGWSLRADRM